MKKLLLSALALGAFYVASAQITTCTSTGVGKNGFFQDFNEAKDYYDPANCGVGVFAWGDTVATDTGGFFAVPTVLDGELQYTITQKKGAYEPVGFSFGTIPDSLRSNPNDSVYTLDLSGSSVFTFDVRNYSTTELKVRIALQDINGKLIDTWYTAAGKPVGDAWKYVIGRTLPANMTAAKRWDALETEDADNIKVPTHVPTAANQKFAGGFGTTYSKKCGGTATYNTGFDFKQVKGVLLTFVAKEPFDNLCYEPIAISGVKVGIDNLRVGDCDFTKTACAPKPNGIGTKDARSNMKVGIAPNPASDEATVSYDATSNGVVKVYDLNGTLVKSVKGTNTSATVSTSDLITGVYMVTVEVDGVPSKASKLVVK